MNQKFTEFIEYSKKRQELRNTKKIDELNQELKQAQKNIKQLKSSQQKLIEIIRQKQKKEEQTKKAHELELFRLQKKLDFFQQKSDKADERNLESIQSKTASYEILQQQNRKLKKILKAMLP